MIAAARSFLTNRIKELVLEDMSPAYTDPIIFFGDIPRDYLKDNDYAANCLMLQDRKKKDGRIITKERNPECTEYVFTRRRFTRTVLYRCFLYAKAFEELWGNTGFIGLVDQLEQKITETDRVIADANNNAVRIELHDAVRPWNMDDEADQRLKRRPYKAIVRVEFTGGIYSSWTIPIVPDVQITPDYQ